MFFNSLDFLTFFAALIALYFFIPSKFKWLILLAASYFFYGYLRLDFLIYLIVPTLLVYGIGLRISKTKDNRRKRWWLILGLMVGLSGLLIFKYSDFFAGSVVAFSGLFIRDLTYNPLGLILPIGISYYSFKMASYLVDVYFGKMAAERHLGYFALYVSFFPQLLMGPIDRAVNFIPELKKRVTLDIDRIISGVNLFVWGLFKKMVVADRLAIIVNELFSQPEGQGLNLLIGAYLYAFQIYCDFSGYTDMAIAIARVLGFKSMDNFDYPYFSRSITQFWNKWHISFSTWLRDYLFLPLAYATLRRIKNPKLLNIKVETWSYIIGMFITMFLGGLWHGARWTFVAWGILHGIYLITSYITKKKRKRLIKKLKLKRYPRLHSFISIFFTFNIVTFAWIFFRAESFTQAFNYIKYIQLKPSVSGCAHLVFDLVIVIVFVALELLVKNRSTIKFIVHMPRGAKIAFFALFLCLIAIFSVDSTNEFIYFQF